MKFELLERVGTALGARVATAQYPVLCEAEAIVKADSSLEARA